MQKAYIVITTPYLCAVRSQFDPQLAHSLLTEFFRDFFGPYGKFRNQVTSADIWMC
jgi:hypothetical protein